MNELLNSECAVGNGWLHDFQTVHQYREGMFDVCTRCGMEKFWPNDISSEEYLSYNVRRGLPRHHPLFEREWPNALV